MTIKWIMYWQPNPGATKSTAQILEELSQCAESINGVNEGPWKSTVSYYRPMIGTTAPAPNPFGAEYMGISLSYEPNKYFMIIREQKIVAEAESNMQQLMERLQSYQMLMSVDFEGILYRLGDFQVRVGIVSYEHSLFRTFVVEMEYLPISSWQMSKELMGNFLDIWKETVSKKSLQGQFVHNEPNFSEYELTDQYSPQHTAVQYANITAQIMEANAQMMRGPHN